MSLDPIQRKLKGWHVKSSGEKEPEKEVKTSNQVEAVIKEATNPANLVSSCRTLLVLVANLSAGQNVRRVDVLDVKECTACEAVFPVHSDYTPPFCNEPTACTYVPEEESMPLQHSNWTSANKRSVQNFGSRSNRVWHCP
jgi:hypothetical protein